MKKNVNNILYCLFIANYVFSETQLIEYPTVNAILAVTRYAIAVLLALMTLKKHQIKLRRKYLLFDAIFIIAIVINMLIFNGGAGLLLVGIIVVAIHCSKKDVEKLVKMTLAVMWMSSLVTVGLCFIGILEDRSAVRYVGSSLISFYDGSLMRHTYGFLVANQVPLLLFVKYIYLIVYKREKMSFYEHLIIFGANFGFLFIFGSRNTFIIILIMMITYFVARKVSDTRKKRKNHKKHAILCLSYPACFIISIIATIKYDAAVYSWRVINNLLMNRIIMSQTAVKTFGISLFGSGNVVYENLIVEGIASSTLDNGYINLLIKRGIIITIIFIAAWSWLTYRAEKEKNFFLVFCLVALAVSNLIDAHLTSYKMIPLFVLMLDKYSHVLTMEKEKSSSKASVRRFIRI